MRGALAVGLVVAGLAFFALAASRGEASVGFFLVFPFLVGTGLLSFVGVLLLGSGLVLGLWTIALRAGSTRGPYEGFPHESNEAGPPRTLDEEWERRMVLPKLPPREPEPRKSAGGFILLGPIPIAFGTTRGMAVAMLFLALVALVLLLVLPRLLGGAP